MGPLGFNVTFCETQAGGQYRHWKARQIWVKRRNHNYAKKEKQKKNAEKNKKRKAEDDAVVSKALIELQYIFSSHCLPIYTEMQEAQNC